MPTANSSFMVRALLALMILLPASVSRGAGGELVDISAEFRYTNLSQWSYVPPSNEERKCAVHCIVGTNLWFIEMNFDTKEDITLLFTGSNVVAHVIARCPNRVPIDEAEWSKLTNSPNPLQMAMQIRWKTVIVTNEWTDISPSDGIAGRGFAAQANVAWLAFCSGPYLNKARKIEVFSYGRFSGLGSPDKLNVFKDELGLPSGVEFSSADSLGEYKVLETTNFQGWTFPLHFQAAFVTRGLQGEEQVIDGRVTSIQPGSKSNIPAGVYRKRDSL